MPFPLDGLAVCSQLHIPPKQNIMAKSKYEYVKEFETDDRLLRNVYILVRVDGKGFHKFSAAHEFTKPNDIWALNLMNHAARSVMHELDDILLAFGESDEFSFLFRKSTDLYQRRESKIVSTVVSLFTSAYVYYWNDYFVDSKRPLYPPVFDGRAVLYPSEVEVKDYFAWRQADTHINNLFNTSFWALVEKGGLTPKAAEIRLSGTDSKDKNEMLFTEFNTNYSKLPAIFRKGSVLLREDVPKNLDKDTIIPTIPETLPGSTSAEAIPSSSSVASITSTASTSTSTLALVPPEQSASTSTADEVLAISSENQDNAGNDKKRQSQVDDDGGDMKDSEVNTDTESKNGPAEKVPRPILKRMKKGVVIDHIDIIAEKFWTGRGAYILAPEKKKKTHSK
ncbi:tRNAHis guanylyltransferase-domain-containing protein [Gamsiella multidivaricata]|uniref:tRNAHis guanylyltransferase-domain-containing protein n=1 Tax=Gamsiella multidivaricata TaxID=101098 RepID=UPI00221F7A73|nr:tRNAHis guanylyltransferase-domain-containing protein [Gamsiella multidivaricata]KAI7821322.1 tRNAHis guanylyltransferase-domain-containing protein [Gamsiella multidivaricata]